MDQNISPAVSVLLSVHNGEKTLGRCLKSVTDQTYENIHIFCIDDASTDATWEILTAWQQKLGEKMTILRNDKNIGLTLSLNKGLEAIATPLIARIDADDWWESKKIEKQVAFLKDHPDYGIVGTNYINHSERQEKKVSLPKTNRDIQKILFWRNPFAHSAVMYRRDIVLKAGKYDPTVRYSQDYELWIRCSQITKLHNIQEFLCHRSIGSGISVDKQNEQMRQYLKVLWKYLPLYKRSIFDYAAMIEPCIILSLPEWLKRYKRRHLS